VFAVEMTPPGVPLSAPRARTVYEPSAGAASAYVHAMLPLLVQGDGHVTELKISVVPLKVVPFQYWLSPFRLMLTPIVRELLLLLKLTAPQTPVGLQPELKVLVEYVPPFAGKVTLM